MHTSSLSNFVSAISPVALSIHRNSPFSGELSTYIWRVKLSPASAGRRLFHIPSSVYRRVLCSEDNGECSCLFPGSRLHFAKGPEFFFGAMSCPLGGGLA